MRRGEGGRHWCWWWLLHLLKWGVGSVTRQILRISSCMIISGFDAGVALWEWWELPVPSRWSRVPTVNGNTHTHTPLRRYYHSPCWLTEGLLPPSWRCFCTVPLCLFAFQWDVLKNWVTVSDTHTGLWWWNEDEKTQIFPLTEHMVCWCFGKQVSY